MSKVDWSLAPEGATHFLPAETEKHTDIWLKMKDGIVLSVGYTGDERWAHDYTKEFQPSTNITRIIERPKQPQAWSGPEDGLPPVGEIVEYNGFSLDLKPGSRVEIIHHFSAGVADAAAFLYYKGGGRYVSQAIAAYFKPVCSAADVAAYQRESAIRELMDIAQVDCRVTAARLVDAGFKREVV